MDKVTLVQEHTGEKAEAEVIFYKKDASGKLRPHMVRAWGHDYLVKEGQLYQGFHRANWWIDEVGFPTPQLSRLMVKVRVRPATERPAAGESVLVLTRGAFHGDELFRCGKWLKDEQWLVENGRIWDDLVLGWLPMPVVSEGSATFVEG